MVSSSHGSDSDVPRILTEPRGRFARPRQKIPKHIDCFEHAFSPFPTASHGQPFNLWSFGFQVTSSHVWIIQKVEIWIICVFSTEDALNLEGLYFHLVMVYFVMFINVTWSVHQTPAPFNCGGAFVTAGCCRKRALFSLKEVNSPGRGQVLRFLEVE